MFQVRRSDERGHFDHGWLDTHHTFSFGDYDDRRYTSFRALRVMNEDRVKPGRGFGMHGHRDMEIVTYVLSGALEHKDSLGGGEILRAGELQRMTAGTGIMHSEFNPSSTEEVHLYQIWLFPERNGLPPSYEQRRFDESLRQARWQVVASRDGRDGSLVIHQDASIHLARLNMGESLAWRPPDGRHAWLQVLRGQATLADISLSAGDGLAVSEEPEFRVTANEPGEFMLFDLS